MCQLHDRPLAHGELDDNVHLSSTLQVVDALIKANKDFNLLVMIGRYIKFYISCPLKVQLLCFLASTRSSGLHCDYPKRSRGLP